MRVTLQSEVSSRNPSSRGRTSCSGRNDGALNLGVRTTVGGPTSGSLEELIALKPGTATLDHQTCTLAVRLVGHEIPPASVQNTVVLLGSFHPHGKAPVIPLHDEQRLPPQPKGPPLRFPWPETRGVSTAFTIP